jgi:hypothetical protein
VAGTGEVAVLLVTRARLIHAHEDDITGHGPSTVRPAARLPQTIETAPGLYGTAHVVA